MRVVVAGLGVQGHKRRRIAGSDFVAAVDPVNADAQYRSLTDVPLSDYDAVLACIPDEPKVELIRYCLENGKSVLVEKPLWSESESDLAELEQLARKNGVVCYTAYNHRFEPHFVRMRDLIASGELGRIYSCRMFYGNGTARLVRDSAWRDQGAGVLPDLGSHLLDTCRFWFGDITDSFGFVGVHCFENRSPDHVVVRAIIAAPRVRDDAADVAQPFYVRHSRGARVGAYSISVQMGPVAFHQAHAHRPQRPAAGRDRGVGAG